MRKRKAGTVQSDTVGYYPRILPLVEITLPRDIIQETPSYTQCKCVSAKDKGVANQLPKNVQPQENNLFRSKTLSMKYVY